MKILHTSDWHLGAMDGEKSLIDDQKFFIDQICKLVDEREVDAVIIAGDVFDRSVANADAIKLYDYAMTKLCMEQNKKVLVIAGNHDSAERLASCRELLSSAGLHVCGMLEREVAKLEFDGADIYLLPWITEEKVKSLFPEKKDEIDSLEDAYRVVTDSIRAGFAEGKKNIIVSHAFITDSETSTSDRAAVIGFATQVPASVIEGFDYVALGHIHKPQDVNEKVRYSGTPMPYSFGKEENQEKSVTVIDTDKMSIDVVPLELLHKRTTLAGTLDELQNPAWDEKIVNGYVRLQVNDSFVGPDTLSKLRKVYPNLCEVSGKNFEGENVTISLSIDDFEKMESNPVDVFRYFCSEEMDMEPSEHLIALFEAAIKKCEGI